MPIDDRPVAFADIAILTGLNYDTIKTYRARRMLPAPDGFLGNTPWWWESRIVEWDQGRRKWPAARAVAERARRE